jgi:hypothetical protein
MSEEGTVDDLGVTTIFVHKTKRFTDKRSHYECLLHDNLIPFIENL